MSSNPFNPMNPSANPFAKKIKNEYKFEDHNVMGQFVKKLSRNPGVSKVDLKGKDTLEVSYRSQETMDAVDNFYKESYQPVEENELARQAKMRKFRQQQAEPRAAKQREIERAREAESRRKGEEAKKRERERLAKKQAAERERLDDSVEPELQEKKKKKGKHDCATHVEHAEFGQGTTVRTMHANPDEDGNIAWYDVMFEHGVEKGVPTEDLNILMSEMHEDHDHDLDEAEKKNVTAVLKFKNDAAGAAAVGSETSRTGLLVGGKKVEDGKYRLTFKDDRMKDKFMRKYASRLGESVELSEMDPKEHVKKEQKNGETVYCVYNKDGKKVKTFKTEAEANKYATDNHDSLMEYGSPMKPGKPRLANQPLVKTGQGSYERTIRPIDILKKKKKKKR